MKTGEIGIKAPIPNFITVCISLNFLLFTGFYVRRFFVYAGFTPFLRRSDFGPQGDVK